MRGKKLLTAFLLGVGLCFVPALGYGEVRPRMYMYEYEELCMEFHLLEAKVNYMMRNPTGFLNVWLDYDETGRLGRIMFYPKEIDTKGKICVWIKDTRDVFSDKSGATVLRQFSMELMCLSDHLPFSADDIVVRFEDREWNLLGYFYQGEYHLWGE